MELGSPVKSTEERPDPKGGDIGSHADLQRPNPKENPPNMTRAKTTPQKGQSSIKHVNRGSKGGVLLVEYLWLLLRVKRIYKPDMVCLFETRCSGIKAETTIKKLGFNYYALNEARGYVGGIWALWNKEIKATCIHNHEQFLQFEIQDQEKGKWNLFVIYANPHAQIRDSVWPLIESKCSNNIPLLLAGDFNEIASISGQRGGSLPNIQRCNKFQSWINKCSLIDLIPTGPFFTWEGPKRHGQRKLFKRLDRALCNQNWRTSFSDASSKCLARIHSDHHHLLITTEDQSFNAKNRPFRFEICWMQHEKFAEFLKKE
ncbi:ribonuclease H [Senna tora]|uniref:Ribonuclease H n=1 Tax=Senna tora TaxID=362788 RepID=A0A835CHI5_9FABA|nr:ribonuclease H [Senna tora]